MQYALHISIILRMIIPNRHIHHMHLDVYLLIYMNIIITQA
jgi:hypothetical protein